MPSITLNDLEYITAGNLSYLVLEQESATQQTYAVVDVRDNDYIGGHIKGAINVTTQNLDAMMPTLARRFKDKKMVVFHCALSQQRGPAAALKYLRERDGALEKLGEAVDGPQRVCVLDQGFNNWQRKYGRDTRLTEDYREELWRED